MMRLLFSFSSGWQPLQAWRRGDPRRRASFFKSYQDGPCISFTCVQYVANPRTILFRLDILYLGTATATVAETLEK